MLRSPGQSRSCHGFKINSKVCIGLLDLPAPPVHAIHQVHDSESLADCGSTAASRPPFPHLSYPRTAVVVAAAAATGASLSTVVERVATVLERSATVLERVATVSGRLGAVDGALGLGTTLPG